MNNPRKILHVVGARPNFMKTAPLMHELDRHQDASQILVHTGQHYDSAMSNVFFQELGLPEPHVNLEVGSGSHAQQTAQIMARFEPVLLEFQPDWVVVPGDVNSTIACSLVAVKLGFPVAHIEAGLRSFDRSMPEEINRILTDQIASLLLTPSLDGNENLRREGIPDSRIHMVGNIMIDTLVRLLPKASARWPALRKKWNLPDSYLLATLHRPSNVDQMETLCELLGALNDLAESIHVVLPLHPRTRQQLSQLAQFHPHPRLLLTDPQGYLDFLALQQHAALVVTDSGGVQEETSYLGVPCITTRPNTERPITITHGTNELVTSQRETIVAAARRRLQHPSAGRPEIPLWDGAAAPRIASLLLAL